MECHVRRRSIAVPVTVRGDCSLSQSVSQSRAEREMKCAVVLVIPVEGSRARESSSGPPPRLPSPLLPARPADQTIGAEVPWVTEAGTDLGRWGGHALFTHHMHGGDWGVGESEQESAAPRRVRPRPGPFTHSFILPPEMVTRTAVAFLFLSFFFNFPRTCSCFATIWTVNFIYKITSIQLAVGLSRLWPGAHVRPISNS